MNGAPIASVLVVGGGTAGWMAAVALAHKLRHAGVAITLVESEAIGTVGVGEATVPPIRAFNAAMGLDEVAFMRTTHATYKLGIEFRDWARRGDRYFHPFAPFGAPVDGVPFHHCWLAAGEAAGAFDDHALPVRMARHGRFAHPGADAGYGYAYQFDATAYAAYLRGVAEARGVARVEGRIVAVAEDGRGGIASVSLEDGRTLAADLFLDCTGFGGLLIAQTLGAEWDDWSHWLPCDHAWAVPSERVGPPEPYTRATALDAGWAWRIPLTHRTGNGHVFASAFTTVEAARDRLLAGLDAPMLAEPRLLRFAAGKRRRQWIGNTVAIGLAAGFLEPLESTSIHLAQVAIERLLDLFPTGDGDPGDAAEFDRAMAIEYERARDLIILHYAATERDDTPFFDHVRTMKLPDSLAEKLELFRARGIVMPYRHGLFAEASWLAVYLGQRVRPRQHDPRATADPAALARLRAAIDAEALAMPRHQDALAR